jgi:replicative DNA helicase
MINEIQTLVLGKLPPQAIELEESVLGALMLEKNAIYDIIDFSKPEMFYKDAHKKIYKAIYNLFSDKKPTDILSIQEQLKRQGELEMVGGLFYLMELHGRSTSAINIEQHAQIVYQKFLQRELIRVCTNTVSDGYQDTTDIFELLNKVQEEIFILQSVRNSKDMRSINDLVKESIIDLEKPPIDGLTGVGSGFMSIDEITNGWQKQDLIIIAARPSMGKTAFILSCARNAAVRFKKPTMIFSLEMSSKQLTNRMISAETGITQDRILKRTVLPSELESIREVTSKLTGSKLFIDDTAALSILDFTAKARRMKRKHDIGLIVIDYLQLMRGKGEKNREQEISTISRSLKAVAKDLDIPIIALSQLSRALESRADKRPMLSDLRESGAIEQDADVVGFLYRPEYYGVTKDERGDSVVGLCEVIFSKNRQGVTHTAKLDFNGSRMRFKDWRIQKDLDSDVYKNDVITNDITEEETPF